MLNGAPPSIIEFSTILLVSEDTFDRIDVCFTTASNDRGLVKYEDRFKISSSLICFSWLLLVISVVDHGSAPFLVSDSYLRRLSSLKWAFFHSILSLDLGSSPAFSFASFVPFMMVFPPVIRFIIRYAEDSFLELQYKISIWLGFYNFTKKRAPQRVKLYS